MRSRAKRLLIAGFAATAVVSGAVGFFIGRVSSPSHLAKGITSAVENSGINGDEATRHAIRGSQSAIVAPDQRVPWTRERLLMAAARTLGSGSGFGCIPKAIRLCETLENDDFPLALEVAKSMSTDYDNSGLFRIFVVNRWAQLDPRGLAEHLQKSASKDALPFLDETAEILLPAWLEQNQLEAVQWVKSIADPAKRTELMEQIVGVIAHNDPDGVIAFTRIHAPELLSGKELPEEILEAWKSGIPEDAARRLAEAGITDELREVAVRWARKDQPAALKWAQGLTEPGQREQALIGVFALWASNDFDKALGVALANEAGPISEKVLDAILAKWPAKDVAGFQTRAASLPNGPGRVKVYGLIANKLAQENATTAANWLAGLPISQEKDEAMAKFAVAAVTKHGAAAMEWAGAIENPAKRESALKTALGEWFRNEPGAAYQWILTSDGMLPEEKQALLKP